VVQGLIFFFWGGSGSHFLLLGRFRVSNSSSGTVQGLNFFFWKVQGDSFFALAASEKGPARFQRKVQILLLSNVARRPLPGQVRNCFWDGSGSHFLLLGRFRVSLAASKAVQGLNFFFWRVQGDSFFTLAASEKGPARFQRKLQILLLSHVARRTLPGQVRNCFWEEISLAGSRRAPKKNIFKLKLSILDQILPRSFWRAPREGISYN